MTTDTSSLRLPAEWEPQAAMQLTWPHRQTDWLYCLEEVEQTYLQLAAAIACREPLIVVAPDVEAVRPRLERELEGVSHFPIAWHACPTNDTWARDHGFLTLTDGHGGRHLLDFRFNGWGEKFAWQLDNAINRSLHAAHVVEGQYEDHDDFVLEGGSIESDGHGTLLTTACCLLAPHRNQPLSRTEIEGELRRRLRADRVLWLDHGHLEGDDTDGHIDTLARLAPDDTIVYVACADPADPHHADLKAMEADLRRLRTREGHAYRLLPLPMAPVFSEDGQRLPATYANFVVVNGAVIVPTYNNPATDRLAMQTVAQAFPGREVVGVDSRTLIRQHGSLHCCTMQFPE